jgi:hypothetical protein
LDPDASSAPSGDSAAHVTGALCPTKRKARSDGRNAHTITVWSAPPDASCALPAPGLKASVLIAPRWPRSVRSSVGSRAQGDGGCIRALASDARVGFVRPFDGELWGSEGGFGGQ